MLVFEGDVVLVAGDVLDRAADAVLAFELAEQSGNGLGGVTVLATGAFDLFQFCPVLVGFAYRGRTACGAVLCQELLKFQVAQTGEHVSVYPLFAVSVGESCWDVSPSSPVVVRFLLQHERMALSDAVLLPGEAGAMRTRWRGRKR